jgi:hypothetical protein
MIVKNLQRRSHHLGRTVESFSLIASIRTIIVPLIILNPAEASEQITDFNAEELSNSQNH